MGAETKSELQPNQANPEDFGAWASLIEEVEKTTPDDIGRICQVYDSFMSEFPLCYGYWKKYADHKARLCDISKVVEVYEQAVQSASYSVHIWVNYCSFGMLFFEDPADVRRLFERGISLVGKDYLSYLLWDKYIEFEYSQKQWGCLAHVYIRTISFPTKKLQSYYESFKIFSAIWEEEIISQNRAAAEGQSETFPVCEIPEAKAFGGKEILRIIRDLLDPGAGMSGPEMLKKFLSAGKHFYQIASDMDAKIEGFENRIRRPYFHIQLLDDVQLENWHHYLDFVELQGDFDWAVKLYERCLIPCANYPEFWIRYVEFVEARGGREIANLALARATQVFLKRVPGIHYFCAKYKEQIGDIFGARAAFLPCSPDLASDFIENITRKANMEKRLGNAEAASIIYEEALDMAKNAQNQQTLSILYDNFSQFIYVASGDIDAARDVLIRGLQDLPCSKFLLQKLIHVEMMHGGQKKIDMIGSIVAQMTAPPMDASEGLSTKEREEISNLFLEFVDLCGTVHEIKKAWECHRKLFPYQMRPTSCNENASNKISMDKVRVVRHENLDPLPHQASGDDKTEGQKQHPVLHGTPPQKDTNLHSNEPVTDHSQQEVMKMNNDSEDGLEQVESAEVVQEHSRIDAAEDVGLGDSLHEDINTQPPDASIERATSSDQTQLELDHAAEDDHKPLDLDTLSINHQDEETPDSNRAKSSNKAPDIASTDGDHSSSNTKCMQSDMQAHAYTHEQTYSQRRAPTTAAFQHNGKAPRNGNRDSHDRHASRNEFSHRRAEAKQLQRRQSAQQNYSETEAHSQMLVTQGYPYQQQPWQVPPVHQADQQYQAAAAQVCWTAPNMQQQAFASVHQSQQSVPSISHPQAPPYQYPAQLSQQHGTMHSYSGFNPQMWYYYQQQQQLQCQTQLPQQHLHPQVHLQQQQQQQQQQQLQEQLQLQQQHHQQINPQQQQQHLQINPQQQQQHLQINPLQQQQQKEPQPQQQQQLPQPQKLQHQQQLSQQQQINPHIQTWHNYYQQHGVLTQYYANNQYGLQDIGSQGHIAGEPNSEQSGRASSESQEQVHSSQ